MESKNPGQIIAEHLWVLWRISLNISQLKKPSIFILEIAKNQEILIQIS